MTQRFGDLEIEQDLTFQRREWIVERVGWAVMVLFVVAAAAGLFGSGYLSHATAAVPGSLRVDYQRFARYQTPEQLTAHVAPAATMAGEVRLAVDREYLDRGTLQSVVPPPIRVEGLADRLVYVFRMAKPGEALKIAFLRQPERLGINHGRVSLESPRGAAQPIVVSFWQLVYP